MKRIAFALVAVAACGYESSQLRLRTAIDAQQDGFHRCYEDALAADARAAGRVKMLVHVPSNASGTIQHVEFSDRSELRDARLESCVRRVLLGLAIGQGPIQNDLLVEYTLDFRPES